MAGNGRQNADDAFALELAAGKTLRDAATAAGIGERTATRRWADPEFRLKVSRLRGEMIGRAVGVMADGMTDAAETLRALLRCKSPNVRLGAARSMLELGPKVRESSELDERVQALESRQPGKGGKS
jgi:hypothetical protein